MRIQIVDPMNPQSEMACVEFTDIPLPEEHFRKMGIASRPTFFRWEKQGLRVLRVGGRRFIYPADLRNFLEAQSRGE